jgi:hypothetical protein
MITTSTELRRHSYTTTKLAGTKHRMAGTDMHPSSHMRWPCRDTTDTSISRRTYSRRYYIFIPYAARHNARGKDFSATTSAASTTRVIRGTFL